MAETVLVSSIGCLVITIAAKLINDSKQTRDKKREQEKAAIIKYTFD